MERSDAVREAVIDFYRGVTNKEIERFDDIVSADPDVLVIGTAPGEWVTDRPRLRFGFQAEGLAVEAGPEPAGFREGSMGWFVDEPRFVLPDGRAFRTRLTAVLRSEAGRWRVVHMHWSSGIPDDEVVELQARWGIA